MEQRVSLAFSTYQTSKLFLLGLGEDEQVSLHERSFARCMALHATERSLYLAAPDTLMDIISQTHDEVETLLLVGHNPGMHELAYALGANSADENAGNVHMDALARKFPTCSLAVIEFDMQSWRDIGHGASHLQRYVTAKSLRRPSDEDSLRWSESDAD